jgi:hypothetical protein
MIDMAPAAPLSAYEPFERREEYNGGVRLARNSRVFRQTKKRGQMIDLSALAVHESEAPEPDHGHDGGSNHKTYKSQQQNQSPSHSYLGTDHRRALLGRECGQYFVCWLTMLAYVHMSALAQSWTPAFAMFMYASAGAFFKSWSRVLVMTAMIAYADARALPPYHPAQIGSGSDTANSSSDNGNVGPPNRDLGLETNRASWSLWATLAIVFISLLYGTEAWVTFSGERVRRIRAMGYICVFALATAATPMVLHGAGGIEAEVKGPLLALWAGGHFNFVLRGAILVRHEQAGYLSPLGYLGVLAVLSHLIFSAADKQNSRLYATLTTLAVTVLQDVGLRASFGGPQAS